jgi:hypothetical protein
MQRVRVHSFHQVGNEWVPFVKVNGVLRQVHLAPQGLGSEAFVSMKEREGLYSGPRGIGKTRTQAMTFTQHVGRGFGSSWKGIWIRPSRSGFTEVKAQLEQTLFPIFGDHVRYNENRYTYTWDSGESLVLGFFAEQGDFSTWLGSSWQAILWEELTEWPDDRFYKQMLSTNRHSGANTPLIVRSTCNPGSVGGVWVRRRFDPPVEPVEGYVIGPALAGDPKLGLSRRAVCDVLSSNQRLLIADPNYGDTIIGSATSSGQEKSWRTGSWDVESGGLFESVWFAASNHFLIPSVPVDIVPNGWTFVPALDWGDSSPSAILWAAVSDGTPLKWPDGRVLPTLKGDYIVLAELYTNEEPGSNKGTGATAPEITRMAVQLEIARGLRYQADGQWKCTVRRGAADPHIFDKQANRGENAPSIADELAMSVKIDGVSQRGLHFEKADNSDGSRVKGWYHIRNRMLATVPPRTRPGFYITADCPELIRTLKHLPRDSKKLDDCSRHAEDHLGDCARYMLGRLPPGEATVRFGRIDQLYPRRRA